MARAEIAVVLEPGPANPAAVLLPMAAGDAVNGNQWSIETDDLLVAFNTDGAIAYDVTLKGVADPSGRAAEDSLIEVPNGQFVVFGQLNPAQWRQSDGKARVDVENAAIKLAVVRARR